jgi:hypothetical protein
MTIRKLTTVAGACLAAISAAGMLAEAPMAAAQGYDRQEDVAPPSGQYAEPPDSEGGANDTYDDRSQQADRDYADRYSRWSAENCVDERNNNAVAGAIIGGVFGAALGASVAGRHDRGTGALVGGALGAGTGAAIGASSSSNACPPGYRVRAGAPAFVFAGPGYGPGYYGPSWYRPWVWSSGRWVYHPYRYWYWNHRHYWRPGQRAHPFRYHYRRW